MKHMYKSVIMAIIIGLFFFILTAATVNSLFIDENGNVAIGHNNPTALLHVNGEIKGHGIVPIGTIMAWHPNLDARVGGLPDGWVRCNGQVLNDAGSVLNGVLIPNLNGDPAGANSPHLGNKAQVFLRGGTTSGIGQNHALQNHTHDFFTERNHGAGVQSGGGSTPADTNYYQVPGHKTSNHSGHQDAETRPVNMSVVWIMRVK